MSNHLPSDERRLLRGLPILTEVDDATLGEARDRLMLPDLPALREISRGA